MTVPTQAAPPSPSPTVLVSPTPDSRLDQLAAEYAALKPLADEYAERLKTITDGIKAELTTAAPGSTSVVLSSSYLAKPLQLSAVESWRLDTKRMKTEAPETYVRWAKKSTSWRLAPTEA